MKLLNSKFTKLIFLFSAFFVAIFNTCIKSSFAEEEGKKNAIGVAIYNNKSAFRHGIWIALAVILVIYIAYVIVVLGVKRKEFNIYTIITIALFIVISSILGFSAIISKCLPGIILFIINACVAVVTVVLFLKHEQSVLNRTILID